MTYCSKDYYFRDAILEAVYIVDVNGRTTTASVECTLPNGREFVATGSSRALKEDEFDTQIGIELAFGRAIRSLGRGILSSGNSKVHEVDAFKRSQREASEKAIAKRNLLRETTSAKKSSKKKKKS